MMFPGVVIHITLFKISVHNRQTDDQSTKRQQNYSTLIHLPSSVASTYTCPLIFLWLWVTRSYPYIIVSQYKQEMIVRHWVRCLLYIIIKFVLLFLGWVVSWCIHTDHRHEHLSPRYTLSKFHFGTQNPWANSSPVPPEFLQAVPTLELVMISTPSFLMAWSTQMNHNKSIHFINSLSKLFSLAKTSNAHLKLTQLLN